MSDQQIDIGDLLEVPEDQRLERDDDIASERNDDEWSDLSSVPDGVPVTLSTADLDDEDNDVLKEA